MRRLRVLALFRKQWPQIKIAEALGITKGYVSQLVKRFRDVPEAEQADTLRIENHAGRKARITPEQTRAILSLVDGGAKAFGFPGDAWTLKKLCQTIQQELDVTVGKSWLSALLHQRGYSCQKPETRAVERNDFAAAGFKGGQWVPGGGSRLKGEDNLTAVLAPDITASAMALLREGCEHREPHEQRAGK